MKSTAALMITTACSAVAEYGPTGPTSYVPESYGQVHDSPYPQHKAYDQYEEYIPAVVPSLEQPYPFTKFSTAEDTQDVLKLPHLGENHCFLTGAPWTQCGRKSLTSYFLDQCMVFHQMMTKNVDGSCFVAPPAPVYNPATLNEYGKSIPTPTAPIEYSGTGYGGAIKDDYLQEKCLQKVFVSITAATVMCLTENTIRIKYIEHYAKDSATNPIEGPILHLKKLHTFIYNVLECTGQDAGSNYPNLWRTFKDEEGHTSYNPNAPFSLSAAGKITYDQTTSNAATGLESSIIGDKFVCSNVDHLDINNKYATLPNKHHYDVDFEATCTASSALLAMTAATTAASLPSAYERKCPVGPDFHNADDRDTKHPTGPLPQAGGPLLHGEQYLVDMTLRNLYDAVHYSEASITDIRRPLTIAELAVKSAGVLEQPILDGFGIMYFCAFHACKANNGGDIDGTCLPEFNAELDWELENEAELKEASKRIEECTQNQWLSNHDISGEDAVQVFNTMLRRSHICMAEDDIVKLMAKIYPSWVTENDAQLWVFGRHLATEKCYETKDLPNSTKCPSNTALYTQLKLALDDLVVTCGTNEEAEKVAKATAAAAYHDKYGGPAPAPVN